MVSLVVHIYFQQTDYDCLEHNRNFWSGNVEVFNLDEATKGQEIQEEQIIKHRINVERKTQEKEENILKAPAKQTIMQGRRKKNQLKIAIYLLERSK